MKPPCNLTVYITVEAATLIGLTFVAATSIIFKSIMAKRKKGANGPKPPATQLPRPATIQAPAEPPKVANVPGPLQGEPSTSTPPVIEEIDHRPDASPYASTPCTVPFASPMTVPKDILLRSPKLHAAFESNLPELPDIPEDIGHVLVHYLHTGSYESLKPKEPFTPSKEIVELKTSIKAYAAARAYDLPDLMRLAQLQIEKFGEGLPLPSLLEITRDSFPTLSEHDDWFLDYLKSRIRPHLEDPSSIIASDLLDRISTILSPNKILLRTVLEMFCERILPRQNTVGHLTGSDSSRPNSPPPPPTSPMALLEMRSRAIVRDQPSPLRKQATPWSSPDPELASVPTDPFPEPVKEHTVQPSTEHELESHNALVQAEPPTSFKIEAEPVLNQEEVFRPTVMPENRERKDSAKLLDMDPEWGLGPVIKDIGPAPEPETPERERPGKRILREVDSGFWEFSPSEPEPLNERAPSVIEILPEPVRELEPVQEITTTPEAKEDEDLIDKRDFAAAEDDGPDKIKSEQPQPEASQSAEPIPVPIPVSSVESLTQSTEVKVSPKAELEKFPEKAELAGSEVMSDTAKVEPNRGKSEPASVLTNSQAETSRIEPSHNAEGQPEPTVETKAEPELLSNHDQPAEPSEAKKAEPVLESQPEPSREPEVTTGAESQPAVEPAGAVAKSTVQAPEPAPQQDGSGKASAEPTSLQDYGTQARSRSWKRKLSLRYPVLFGRGM